MKNIGRALVFLSGLIIFGCTNSYTVSNLKDPHDSTQIYNDYVIKRPFGTVKIVGVNKQILKMIERDFYSAPLAAQFSVSEIRIYHDPEDPEFRKKSVLAHFHANSQRMYLKFDGYKPYLVMPQGIICINCVYPNGTLRHEMSHAQVFFFGISLVEIAEISKWKYIGQFWDREDEKQYPKNGFLYAYSRSNACEETARIVGAISNFYFGLQDPFNSAATNVFYCIDKKDERYLKKIEVIHAFGLTTKAEYQKILEFFNKPR